MWKFLDMFDITVSRRFYEGSGNYCSRLVGSKLSRSWINLESPLPVPLLGANYSGRDLYRASRSVTRAGASVFCWFWGVGVISRFYPMMQLSMESWTNYISTTKLSQNQQLFFKWKHTPNPPNLLLQYTVADLKPPLP